MLERLRQSILTWGPTSWPMRPFFWLHLYYGKSYLKNAIAVKTYALRKFGVPHTSHNTVQSKLCESNARGVLLDEVILFFQLRKFPLEEIFPNYNQSKEEKTTERTYQGKAISRACLSVPPSRGCGAHIIRLWDHLKSWMRSPNWETLLMVFRSWDRPDMCLVQLSQIQYAAVPWAHLASFLWFLILCWNKVVLRVGCSKIELCRICLATFYHCYSREHKSTNILFGYVLKFWIQYK